MKRFSSVVIALAAIALAAACGSSGSSSSTNNVTPTTASAKATSMATNAAFLGYQTYAGVQQALAGGVAGFVVTKGEKSTTFNGMTVNCTAGSTFDSYDCTFTDAMGGTAHVTGSFTINQAGDLVTFVANQTYTNFRPDAEILLDGSMNGSFVIRPAAFGSSAAISVEKTSADQCTLLETETEPLGCTSGGTCAEANAALVAEFTVGADGLTVTDSSCPQVITVVFSPSYTMQGLMCFTSQATSMTMTWTTTGNVTVNGDTVSSWSGSWTCDLTQF